MKSSEIKSLFPRFEAAASTYQDVECWSARELQNLLGYGKWENFAKVIDKAKEASSNAGFQVKDHFPDVRKMVPIVSARCHRHSGLPEPLIVERTGGVAVELLKTPDSEKFVSERQGNDFGTISERIRKEFGCETAKTFEIIRQHPEFTAGQIAEKLDKTSRMIENYTARLKKAGFITRRGPKLGGHWEVLKNE